MEWKQYHKKGIIQMRPYIQGESLDGISVSKTDSPKEDMGMVARNPNDHNDMWYVNRKFFEEHYKLKLDIDN